MRGSRFRAAGIGLAGLALSVLPACGGGSEAASEQSAAVTIADPWVKSTEAEAMTAAFGTLTNASDEDVTVVAAETDVSPTVELHEMAGDDAGEMVMREKEGGFVIEAGGEHELSPGGDHLMFLDPSAAIEPGQEVRITLTFADDSTMSFTAPARDFAGANEDYDPEGHDHGSGDDDH